MMRPFFLISLLIFILQPVAHAEITLNFWGPPAEVRIRVGAETGVTTVTHDVPATHVGDGTPVEGTPNSVLIEASARRATSRAASSTYFIISVDSSTPLSSGTNTISFTNISWTAQDGDIPAGTFTGVTDQVIVSFPSSRRIRDWHTFSYANTRDVEAGDYVGRVVYTWAIP